MVLTKLKLPGIGGGSKNGRAPAPEREKRRSPLFNALVGIRFVERDVVVDYGWKRYAVFEVKGTDSSSDVTMTGWQSLLNSMECQVQILIRQHQPDMGRARDYHLEKRPDTMRSGRVGQVADSLIDLLDKCEETGTVITRRYYLICDEGDAIQVASFVMQANLRATRLEGTPLWNLYSGCVSGMGAGHHQDFYQASIKPSEIQLNRRLGRVYDVAKWPRNVTVMFIERLLQTGVELDISFWIWPLGFRESHQRLMMQKGRFEGARLQALEQGKMVRPDVEATIEDSTRLLHEVEKGLSKLYRVSMTIAGYGRDKDELRTVSDKIVGHFRSQMAVAKVLRYRQGDGFKALMPALRRGVCEPYLTDTGTMLRLFPFSPPDMDAGIGTFFGVDRRSRSPVMFDSFNYGMNGHQVVMARSGAGKSFYVKLRTFRQGTQGIPIYVIDPDGEYGVLAEAMGGRVLVPGRPGHGLNPFAMSYTNDGDMNIRIIGLCKLVEVMLQGEVDQRRRAAIDSCLTGFYRSELEKAESNERSEEGLLRLGTGGMNAFYEFLQSGVQGEPGAEMVVLLERFATGSVQYLLSGTGGSLFEDEKPVTTFNLRHLPSDLKPVATSVCSEVVWGLAISKPKDRVLVVDECWTVLATPSGAEALLTIAKRARKYKLGLLCITQDVQDFLAEDKDGGAIAGHAGLALLQNSGTKLILSQDPAALPLVAQALQLNEDCERYLKSVSRGQGLLITDDGNFPMEIVSTPEERLLINDEAWRQDGEGADVFGEDNEDMSVFSLVA